MGRSQGVTGNVKRNEMKRNETKRNETKRNETKRNDTGTHQVFVELGHAALILENQKCEVYQSLHAIESKQNEGSTEVPNNDCESRRNERFDISTIIACRNVVTRNQTSHFQARSLKLF